MSGRRQQRHHHGGLAKRQTGKEKTHYNLAGGIPWPELGDGTPWRDGLERVTHRVITEEGGKLQWVEWCKPDGSYMPNDQRTKTRTVNKSQVEETNPGAWYGIVAWDNRDTWHQPKLVSRHLLANLVPETVAVSP